MTPVAKSRLARASVCALSTVVMLACKGDGRAPNGALTAPDAEFLVAAGDSTYWIRSNAEGMRVRSAPILLTQVDGRLFEIFIGDEGAEYPEASFATARLWSRAIESRDSTLLFADSTVLRELAAWRKAHPRESEIDPSADDVPDDPQTIVQDDIEIIDAHGPYLTFEHLLDVDIDGGPEHIHTGRRFVVDVRTGHRASLADVLGSEEAARATAAARASLSQLTDSIRAAGASGDERAAAAVESLDSFVFDSSSFGITDAGREPAIAFMVPGKGPDGEALAMYLPPIRVKAPAWWAPVQRTLPEWATDSSLVRWRRERYDVLARPSAEGDLLALSLQAKGARDTLGTWPVTTVAAPAYQLIALESPPLDSAARAALARAFDVSTALDGLVQRARFAPSRSNPMPRTLLRRVSHTSTPP
jgi:hypothetical protein